MSTPFHGRCNSIRNNAKRNADLFTNREEKIAIAKFLVISVKMSAVTKIQVLSIYKSLIRESQKFTNYNFRAYAIRRVRDAFKDNRRLSDQKTIKKEYDFAKENLNIIRRQVIIGDMYGTEKLVIENQH